jgi:predicted DNA-binding protein YlxM (UPF0122 family)
MNVLPPYAYFNVIYGLSLTDDPSTIRYVGQTMDLRSRVKGHLQCSKTPSTPVHYWIASHPDDTLVVHVLEQLDSPLGLDEAEMRWIASLGTHVKAGTGGLNCDTGGKGVNSYGYRHSLPTRQAISEKVRGEKAPNAVLTEADVLEVRRLFFSDGLRSKELAEKFEVSGSTIQGIIKRRKWKHLPISDAEQGYTKKRSTKAVLTDDQVLDIRKRLDDGDPVSSVATLYSVSRGTIYFIRDRVTYANL